MRPPAFWSDPGAIVGRLLAPLGWLYQEVTRQRLAGATPWRAPVPVVCVGNLTAGGSGKTPVARDLAARLLRAGKAPHVLSRGYGGRATGPLRVDPAFHGAAEVGDEPLLLARDAPAWIAADRAAGARAIAAAGGGTIVLDDGLQNPTLAQDLRIVVIDGESGFGNGRGIPAGPLRERVDRGLARADAVVLIGDDRGSVAPRVPPGKPVLRARIEPRMPGALAGVRVLGFAGIGRPEKFRATLAAAGAEIAAFRAFADHHPFGARELARMAADAERMGAMLVTTEKDQVRLPPDWRGRVRAVPVVVRWEDERAVDALLAGLGRGG